MKTHIVPHVEKRPEDWSAIPAIELDACLAKSPTTAFVEARICWSEEAFHVQLHAADEEILARYTKNTDPVWTDSCLEIFFSPMAGDGRYFNFECNPNGAVCFGFGYGRYDRIKLLPYTPVKELCSLQTNRVSDGWTVEYSMPESLIRLFFPTFRLKQGITMRANFYKCGDDLQNHDERTWNPITNGKTDYHQPEFFGQLIFG